MVAGDRPTALTGGLVLLPGADEVAEATVICRGEAIETIVGPDDQGQPTAEAVDIVDVGGRLILPGIVDLHGDAFERCLMPRPGVTMGTDLALADNDAQLLAAGITTAYLSATDSWEPGLRSRDTLRGIVEAMERRDGGPDVRLHVRHERCNTDAHDELLGLLADGRVGLLSYNDHTADRAERLSMTQLQRTGMEADELGALQVDRAAQRSTGAEQERELADLARRVGCPTASHDPHTEADLQRDRDLGVAIAEFPTSIELAERYRADGIPVLLGAPNLVRGGSHLGNLSVAEALVAGAGDILCSDYHYPSLLQAPFDATARGVLAFGPAWRLVSENPARAVGLEDRGRVEAGQRADLLIVEPAAGTTPARLVQMMVAGSLLAMRP